MQLDLKTIVNVKVNLASRSAARKGFNVALILGPSTAISTGERVKIYTSVSAMLQDGFTTDTPEYKAASLYFSATSGPTKLAVGVKGEEESFLAAAKACREKNGEWYVLIPLEAKDADILQLAEWAEAASPDTLLAYTTSDDSNLSNTVTGDVGEQTDAIFKRLKSKNYRRSFGMYSSTSHAVAAVMGYAMGQNTGLNNSAFTLAYKKLPGVSTDDLSETQVLYVCGDSETAGVNGNVYVRRSDAYDVLQEGCMADGTYFDEVLNLDMLKNEIVLSVMDLLTSQPKIPDTEPGVNSIVAVINTACEKFVNSGFIAPGVWNGGTVLTLKNGTTLDAGYIVLSEPVADQSQADRDARKAPPIYVCIKTAGAIHYVTIAVNVNR